VGIARRLSSPREERGSRDEAARLALQDESLSHQIGRAARNHVVKRYSVERMASEYAALYTSALASRENAASQTAALFGC
jgi:hypothetical protein